MRNRGLPTLLVLLAGCSTLAPGSPANAARRPDQTAVIQAVAKMARRGQLMVPPNMGVHRLLRTKASIFQAWAVGTFTWRSKAKAAKSF